MFYSYKLVVQFPTLIPSYLAPMAPKRREGQAGAAPSTPSAGTVKPTPAPSTVPKPTPSKSANASVTDIALNIWQNYTTKTPQRTLLLDTFMAFLVLVGGIQFIYCVLAGNYVSLSFGTTHITPGITCMKEVVANYQCCSAL